MSNSVSVRTQPRADSSGSGRANLSLVAPPSPGERARDLFEEARAVSMDHLDALGAEIVALRGLLQAVIDAGDLYVPGLREFSARLSEDLFWRSKTLAALSQRQAASGRRITSA